jgi:hypothetical protein
MKVKDFLKQRAKRESWAEKQMTARMQRALKATIEPIFEIVRTDPKNAEQRVKHTLKPNHIKEALRWLYVDWGYSQFNWFANSTGLIQKKDDFWRYRLQELFDLYGADKVTEIMGTTLDLVIPSIKEAIALSLDGASIDTIEKALRQSVEGVGGVMSKARATMIARTEVISASNQSSYEAVRSSGANVEKKWLTGGRNIRPTHKAAEAQDWIPFDQTFTVGQYQMLHPGASNGGPEEVINCYLPDTEIQSAIIGAQRSFYSGKVVEIVTVGAKRLTITPNHNILTSKGMIKAINLNVSDYLLCNTEQVDSRKLIKRNNINNKKPLAADIFNSISVLWGSYFRPVIHLDFDNDGRNINGNIDIVNPNINLLPSDKIFIKDFGKFAFKQANSKTSLIERFCSLNFGFNRMLTPANRFMSLLNLSFPFGFGHFRPFKFAGFGLTANHYAMFNKMPSDNTSFNSENISQLLKTYPSMIHLDKILKIRNYNFSGHVYDFSSLTGTNIANNIYTSNCKCILIFRVKD